MMTLDGRVAIVTGGSKGIGRGVAIALAAAGAKVFATGRTADPASTPHTGIAAIRCDHRNDEEVDSAFQKILGESPSIDILVNAVWGGYDNMVEGGEFTWPKPFWSQPLWRWDAMFAAGVRAHYRASQLVAPSMIAAKRGLIINISHWAAQKRVGNVAYGVAKAATDKMTSDTGARSARRRGRDTVSRHGSHRESDGIRAVARLVELRVTGVLRPGDRGARH
jgi:NAD(P)-dependent dehydrogenase (short-subunit alcohol dehydrogenase family)